VNFDNPGLLRGGWVVVVVGAKHTRSLLKLINIAFIPDTHIYTNTFYLLTLAWHNLSLVDHVVLPLIGFSSGGVVAGSSAA
jgi:hypothetical protein